MPAVDILRVAKMDASNSLCHSRGTVRCDHQVDMVGHQTKADDRQIRNGRFLGQKTEVGKAIVIDKEYVLTIIATLGNVMRYIGDDNARGSRHEK